ncbi:MAG: nucleoside triphosphate pyrophosphatase [Micropruina sp.]
MRLILASASPARLETLRRAGLSPEVIVSGVDEDAIAADTPAQLAARLADLKAEAVSALVIATGVEVTTVIVGCDSLLEVDGTAFGKPSDPEDALQRWQRLRGSSGVLHTGHRVIVLSPGSDPACAERTAVASTIVHFAELTDQEIEAYVATGEPLAVAGAFTVDGFGGPFVVGIEGDHHNVVGISLPLLRVLLGELGVAWPALWR